MQADTDGQSDRWTKQQKGTQANWLAGWLVDCKDRLAEIAEWLSDYISLLTGWTVDRLDKQSNILNPARLFSYKCQTGVGSVCLPDWEEKRVTERGKSRGRDRHTQRHRQGYGTMLAHQCSDR